MTWKTQGQKRWVIGACGCAAVAGYILLAGRGASVPPPVPSDDQQPVFRMEPARDGRLESRATRTATPVVPTAPSAPGLRVASPEECRLLETDTTAQKRLFTRHLEFLAARMPDPRTPTMAWVRARASVARAVAAASELAAGRAWVRTQEVPLQVVEEVERARCELVLLDGGETRGFVILDPGRHPEWASAWGAYQAVRRKEREAGGDVYPLRTRTNAALPKVTGHGDRR